MRAAFQATVLVLWVASGRIALASIPDANGVLTACVLRGFDGTRVIDTAEPSQACDARIETRVSWREWRPGAPAGASGVSGVTGWATVAVEPPGANCASGGTRIADAAGNVAFVCYGAVGPAACVPGGTCSASAKPCAYDTQCSPEETCTWTRSFARFVDNGDETVTDRRTCLMWEKKAGPIGASSACPAGPTCSDPHGVNNLYTWDAGSAQPEGAAVTDFLAALNASSFAGHDDWRLPTVGGSADPSQCSTGSCITGQDPELDSILTLPYPSCLSSDPCIDPAFGPTNLAYWSSSIVADGPRLAWVLGFATGRQAAVEKHDKAFVRAVRRLP